jgi:hypothetical protein
VRERPFERGSDCWGVRSNLLPKSQSGFQGSGRVKWPQRTGTRTRPGSLDSAGRGAHRTPTGGPNLAAVGEQESKYGNDGGRNWPGGGGTGLWRGERRGRTRPHESAHPMRSWIEHTGGIILACDSRAHLKAWSNRPSWKISLHTHTHTQKRENFSKSTGKLGSFVFFVFVCAQNTQTHKHKNTNGPLFLRGSVGKTPSPQDEPPSRCVCCVFVCFVCLCTQNTQTQKHKRTPISVWVGRKNAKSPGRAPE